jgi:hypothetical protein
MHYRNNNNHHHDNNNRHNCCSDCIVSFIEHRWLLLRKGNAVILFHKELFTI